MKKSEKDLLNTLRYNKVDEPLMNVKNSLGAIANVVGNPLMKAEISLIIRTEIFDLNGGGVILPAALPAFLQQPKPVLLFGLTDLYGGHNRMNNLIPIMQPWWNGVIAGNYGIFGYNFAGFLGGGMGLTLNPENGDMISQFQYTDAFNSFAIAISIHCTNVAYGTFLNSFVSDLITIDRLRYIVPIANINQFINPLIFANQTLFGKTTTDNIDPRLYILPTDFQQQISDIPLNLPISKSVMLGFQLDVFCQQVNFVLFVKKVEALTHTKTNIIQR